MTEQSKVFNDPIHRHVELHPLLVKIIDTPQFQRLRNIKQLGAAYYVYPGASHNRFEHSIGVAHLAGELVKALRMRQPELDITDEDVLCVQIAGLCHDLGHGPFSHLYDRMFIPKARPGYIWKHEKASLDMLDHLVDCNNLREEMVGQNLDLDFIKKLIEGQDTNAAQGEKSFLYQIVANKQNGIDVDKFDYFARDCHHLGMQSNFDYHRFIKFARVCEVDGQKHICMRDKEVANQYNLFYTRYCLHRRAYQHKVNKIIETMIAEAFLKADGHIQFEGSGGKMFTLSTAIDDMEAYTKLTDSVFEQILNSSSKELAEAREILHKIITRKHYRFLGEIKPKSSLTKEKIDILKKELAEALSEGDELKPQDFEVSVVTLDYGSKDKDPIRNVYFYRKTNVTEAFKIPRDQVSQLLPERFSEQLIRVHCKKTDENILRVATKRLRQWCERKGFPLF
ncbi:deoxynucleoside triphosphate triphosphohydrolase SAMHD1-like [Plectropomus leopardus]|uniref:deoxynucleoside triphosphate triphosphohydrolase SAMHD1-like n=1 Tax=Plectropomus leopardus TaxID=160734 RepID=UPI001C4D3F62|nr:deoxynucleoside triphosphate triphosphohydrolase SAMHD1-like [Plectropomus leopardus]